LDAVTAVAIPATADGGAASGAAAPVAAEPQPYSRPPEVGGHNGTSGDTSSKPLPQGINAIEGPVDVCHFHGM